MQNTRVEQDSGRPVRNFHPLLRALPFLIGVLALGSYLLLYVLPLPSPRTTPLQPQSTRVLDREGRLLYESSAPGDARHTYLAISEIPERLKQAVVATEDASFYSHNGVDPSAVGRAAVDAATHLSLRSGGSTITQQLARNLYLGPEERSERTPWRKAVETLHALRIERAWSKDEILELYLNRCYFGNLAYGVEAASRTYFAKSAVDLDLAESALIAGLLQSPSTYDPFSNLPAAKARQSDVLRLMVEAGYLTPAEAEGALTEPLLLNRTPYPIKAPHFVAWVMQQLPELIGDAAAARGDLRVYTSLDLSLQTAAEASLRWHLSNLQERNVTSGAIVAIEPGSGQVLTMVGSADYFDGDRAGNVNASLAPRQPGSAIKPVVYAAALEQGFTASTPLLDIPTSFQTRSGEVYAPANYDQTFHGVVPLREALASSYNVPAVRLLQEVGVESAVLLGQRLGLTTLIDPKQYDLSLTLGGGEVRLIDLTAAYGAFATGGLRVDPVAVLRVETADGRTLYEAPEPAQERVLSAETAYLISDILSDNTARAPAFGLNSALVLARPAAAKTGTTTDFRDNWTVGYTPELAVGVWVGNPDATPMRNVSGIDGAAPVWRDVMNAGLKDSPAREFVAPSGIERAVVCLPSGLLPTSDCQRRREEVFRAGTAPTRADDYYRRVSSCDVAGVCTSAVYDFVPYEAIPWARSAGLDLPPLSPYSTRFSTVGAAPGASIEQPLLRLVSPADGLVLSLSREVALADQLLTIEALPSVAVRYVELLVDGETALRLDAAPYRLTWPLREGVHRIEARAVDLSGNELRSAPARLQVLAPTR